MNLFQISFKILSYYDGKIPSKRFQCRTFKTTQRKNSKTRQKLYALCSCTFCHTFCPYCSFHKYYYDEKLAKVYFQNLREEIKIMKDKGFDFTSMYVGGGTTLIDEEDY